MTDLPEPDFVEFDPAQALAECIEWLEGRLGRPVEPEQLERVIVDLIVYREQLQRVQINEAAKQCLVAFARYPMIDYLAQMIGAERLPAQRARVPLTFAFSALATAMVIPSGFRVRSKDGKVVFSTVTEVTLGAGATSVTVTGESQVPGPAANGYAPGQISEPLDTLPVSFTVANSAESSGGAPSEDTERLRARFPSLVRGLSVAGPIATYEHLARSASVLVRDTRAVSLEPFVMTVYVLAQYGAPDLALLELVDEALDPIEARPGLDEVEVVAAAPVEWELEVELRLRRTRRGVAETAADLDLAISRAEAYAESLRAGLGRPPVESQIVAQLLHPGVYSLRLIEPDGEVAVGPGEWADCVSITVSVVGYEGGP